MKVLFVEDEKLLAEALKHFFENNGIPADVANDGPTGMSLALSGLYDLIVLDVMLPGGVDGLDILKSLREKDQTIPVIMLTAKDTLEDKVRGLNLGADDYLVKPFEADELLARVNALRRRLGHTGQINNGMTFGDLTLLKESSEVLVDNQLVSLTGKEFAMLELLAKNSGHPLSKSQIREQIWGENSDITENSVELYIHYLRKKLKNTKAQIKTIRNQGYLLSQ